MRCLDGPAKARACALVGDLMPPSSPGLAPATSLHSVFLIAWVAQSRAPAATEVAVRHSNGTA